MVYPSGKKEAQSYEEMKVNRTTVLFGEINEYNRYRGNYEI